MKKKTNICLSLLFLSALFSTFTYAATAPSSGGGIIKKCTGECEKLIADKYKEEYGKVCKKGGADAKRLNAHITKVKKEIKAKDQSPGDCNKLADLEIISKVAPYNNLSAEPGSKNNPSADGFKCIAQCREHESGNHGMTGVDHEEKIYHPRKK